MDRLCSPSVGAGLRIEVELDEVAEHSYGEGSKADPPDIRLGDFQQPIVGGGVAENFRQRQRQTAAAEGDGVAGIGDDRREIEARVRRGHE